MIVFYEAPHRIRESLTDLQASFGDRRVAIGRELTKKHEELVVLPISDYLRRLSVPKGEFTVVVSAPERDSAEAAQLPDKASLVSEFGEMTDKRLGSRRDVVRRLAEKYRVPTKEMYRLLENARRD